MAGVAQEPIMPQALMAGMAQVEAEADLVRKQAEMVVLTEEMAVYTLILPRQSMELMALMEQGIYFLLADKVAVITRLVIKQVLVATVPFGAVEVELEARGTAAAMVVVQAGVVDQQQSPLLLVLI